MPIDITHKIYTEYGEDRSYWSCSCGCSGSAPTDQVDIISDNHIPKGGHRIDTNRPL